MPTATPFAALGKGNGFPFCLGRVDVDDFDYWTTLGGYNKDSEEITGTALEESINESLIQAMKIYWNLYAINGTCFIEGSDTEDTLSLSASQMRILLSPKERACGYDYESGDSDVVSEENNQAWLNGYFELETEISSGFYHSIVMLYSNDNYIGLGLEPYFPEPSAPDYDTSEQFLNYCASARFTDLNDAIGNSAAAYECLGSYVENGDENWEYSYESFSGCHFLKATYDYFQGSDPEPKRIATIDSLDFYTYA